MQDVLVRIYNAEVYDQKRGLYTVIRIGLLRFFHSKCMTNRICHEHGARSKENSNIKIVLHNPYQRKTGGTLKGL